MSPSLRAIDHSSAALNKIHLDLELHNNELSQRFVLAHTSFNDVENTNQNKYLY